jgi:hybrid polyketide synthase / nonribosomal peptide synthetase ACE1
MTHVLTPISECFSAKLQLILQLSAEEIDHQAPLVELGVDSLVAVEVRAWFLKELRTDMPVLKVMGGGSVSFLCQQALEKLPEKLLPNVGKSESTGATAATPMPVAQKALTTSTNPPSDSTSSEDSASSIVSSTPVARSGSPSSELSVEADSAPKEVVLPQPVVLKTEPISFAQSRFWFLHLLLEDQTAFNLTCYFRLSGNLRVGDLERAVKVVGQRHEALRTCFLADSKEADMAYQGIMASSTLRLEQKKVDNFEEVLMEYEDLRSHPLDLTQGHLFRVMLLSLSPTSHYLLFCFHHIVMDGVSLQIFQSDLEKAYKGLPLGPPPRQFPDFSSSQLKAFETGEMDDELNFWRDMFRDPPPVLDLLPISKTSCRVPMKTFMVNQVKYRLEPSLAARVKKMSTSQRSTTFHFYLAAFKTMLFRFLKDTTDLTIGIADANRTEGDVMNTIGFFLNLLALRFRYVPSQHFSDAITEARNTAYAALANSRLPFDILLKELNVPRSSAYSPIFQAFFDYRQGAQEKLAFGNCQLELEEAHPGRTAYDITLDVAESSAGTLIMIRTQKSLYGVAEAELLMRTYVNLLEVFSNDVTLSLQDAPLFSEAELSRAIGLCRGKFLYSDIGFTGNVNRHYCRT